MKSYRYGNFIVKEENIMKRKLNYKEINKEYYSWFVSYLTAGRIKDDIYYIEKGFKILLDLENNNSHHNDIMKMYRFIKKENDGIFNKYRNKLNQLKLEGNSWQSSTYMQIYN